MEWLKKQMISSTSAFTLHMMGRTLIHHLMNDGVGRFGECMTKNITPLIPN
jgi:hypothetical protein